MICLIKPPVSSDDQVKTYIKKIMSQLNKWMIGGKISKLVVVITDRSTGENVERWQFDVRTLYLLYGNGLDLLTLVKVQIFGRAGKERTAARAPATENMVPE